MLGKQAVSDVARLADLATLDGNVCAKGPAERFGQGFGPIQDEEVAAFAFQPARDPVVAQSLDRGRILGRALNNTQRVLWDCLGCDTFGLFNLCFFQPQSGSIDVKNVDG